MMGWQGTQLPTQVGFGRTVMRRQQQQAALQFAHPGLGSY